MKNSSDTIGNRSRDPTDCSAVHQPSAPPGAPFIYYFTKFNVYMNSIEIHIDKISLYMRSLRTLLHLMNWYTNIEWIGYGRDLI